MDKNTTYQWAYGKMGMPLGGVLEHLQSRSPIWMRRKTVLGATGERTGYGGSRSPAVTPKSAPKSQIQNSNNTEIWPVERPIVDRFMRSQIVGAFKWLQTKVWTILSSQIAANHHSLASKIRPRHHKS
jgi:hypothetical protein